MNSFPASWGLLRTGHKIYGCSILARAGGLAGIVAFEFYGLDNHLLRSSTRGPFVDDDVPISMPGFLVASLLWPFPWAVFAQARLVPPPDQRPHAGARARDGGDSAVRRGPRH